MKLTIEFRRPDTFGSRVHEDEILTSQCCHNLNMDQSNIVGCLKKLGKVRKSARRVLHTLNNNNKAENVRSFTNFLQ
ncbi:hypothetical protein TNCV_4049691 [Trichonephila clavipes]|nr:hypothetical protein TNCV_4049691 [Trichonephila clavipes]